MKARRIVLFLSLALFLMAAPPSAASVTLLDKDQWKISLGGFVEFDAIVDSARSFTEVIGNTPVDRQTSYNGLAGRTQFSIRNSRLAFTVEAPEVDSWQTKGYFEFDLLGYDPSPTQGSTVNTEANFFNNPTFRARHAYIAGATDGWDLMAGQYWALFGWQPYYFMPSIQVAPLPAMLYSRTAQARVTKSIQMPDNTTLFQAALGVMRPPQRDSSIPGFEGGLRLAFGSRTGGFTGGAVGPQKPQPMSIGVTGAFREFTIPTDTTTPTGDLVHYPGHALAVDALFPILASPDNKDVSNTFTIGGEFTTGTGYGDQFNSWTGNLPSPTQSAGAPPQSNVNLDAGIGGFDPLGSFQLVNLTTFNGYFQYHLDASTRTWFSGGYGRLYSDNIGSFTAASNKVPYYKEEVMFGNVFHDFTSHVRMGLEYAFVRTSYQDGMLTHNNRYQLSAWFLF
jgi:hypothetical protein